MSRSAPEPNATSWRRIIAALVLGLVALGCASSGAADDDGLYPDVVDAVARQADDGTWEFDVTISSPYDSPERYADAWRVLGPDGDQLAIRELNHDHASEQPFTRSLSGVAIPADLNEVTIQGRDQVNGWGGDTVTVRLTG